MDIFKDCIEIWSRLFDHRPFLNGELKFMLREFEEKRNDREIEHLFGSIQNVIEIKDNQIDRLKQLTSAAIPELTEKLNVLAEESDAILRVEKSMKADDTLEKNREDRKKEWSLFIEDVSDKYTRIDNAFEQKEEELKDLYADLEHKLVITTK